MEFGNLGKHCSETTCRQKDFLPFTCKFCEKTFCLDHREFSAHSCPKQNKGDIRAIPCPGCMKTLKYDASILNETEFFDIHYATECAQNYNQAKAEKNKVCEAPKCNTKLLAINTYNCDNCGKRLCLAHRYQDKHECKRVYKGGANVVDDSHLFKNKPVQNTSQPFKPINTPITTTAEKCDLCGSNFRNLEELFSHAEQVHYARENNSNNSNNARNNDNNQVPRNCGSEVNQEVCGICQKSFSSLDGLIMHAQTAHYAN